MIELIWHWDHNYLDDKSATVFDIDRMFKKYSVLEPIVVRTKEERDYLLGLQYMYGVEMDIRLRTDKMGVIPHMNASFFSVRGLPPT